MNAGYRSELHPGKGPLRGMVFTTDYRERTGMRLGLTQKKHSLTGATAWLLAGGILVVVTGCSADMSTIFVDALGSALDTAVPAIMDLLKTNMAGDGGGGDGGTPPIGGGNGFLPVVMREAVQVAQTLLA